jgi:hypothetical protein
MISTIATLVLSFFAFPLEFYASTALADTNILLQDAQKCYAQFEILKVNDACDSTYITALPLSRAI